jgi:hypothetical protein
MYQQSKFIKCITGLIGFSNDYNSNIPEVDEDLLASRSARYVNQLHELLTYDNLLIAANQFNKYAPKAWINTKNYKLGDVIGHNNVLYRALRDNVDKVPDANGDDWAKTNAFSNYLRTKYVQSALAMIDSIITTNKLNGTSRTLFASRPLFVGQGYVQHQITKTGAFRGLRIAIRNADTIILLRAIALQTTAAQQGINIYLYHSSRIAPVKIIPVNQPAGITYTWHTIADEIQLAYKELSAHTLGGYWYIGVYEDELTGNLIEKEISFTGVGSCGSCADARENSNLYNSWSNLISVKSFYVAEENTYVDKSIWDEVDEVYEDRRAFGINLQFAVECDITDVLCENNGALTSAFAQQLKVDLLSALSVSLRTNQLNEKIAALAKYELEGSEGKPGELAALQRTLKALHVDLSGLSKFCAGKPLTQFTQSSVWR